MSCGLLLTRNTSIQANKTMFIVNGLSASLDVSVALREMFCPMVVSNKKKVVF